MDDGNVRWLITKGVYVGWQVVGWVMGTLAGYLQRVCMLAGRLSGG